MFCQKRFLISRFLKTKEQKARLQCLAISMPKSVMPSGAKYDKVSKKRKNLAVLVKTPRLKCFCFSAKLLSSKVKTVALTRAPENVVENHDISFEARFTLRLWLAILTCYFSGVFVCNIWFLLIVRVNVVSCRFTLS